MTAPAELIVDQLVRAIGSPEEVRCTARSVASEFGLVAYHLNQLAAAIEEVKRGRPDWDGPDSQLENSPQGVDQSSLLATPIVSACACGKPATRHVGGIPTCGDDR